MGAPYPPCAYFTQRQGWVCELVIGGRTHVACTLRSVARVSVMKKNVVVTVAMHAKDHATITCANSWPRAIERDQLNDQTPINFAHLQRPRDRALILR